jgi:hypothetical protein
MAAPVEIEDANWHRSQQLHKECGWKRDDSTMVKLRKERGNLCASRWSAISILAGATKTGVDSGGLLMEVADDPARMAPMTNSM